MLAACNVSDESAPVVGANNQTTNNATTSNATTNNVVVNNATTNNATTNNGMTGPANLPTAANQRCAGGGMMSGGGYIVINCSGPDNVGVSAAQSGTYQWEPGASKVLFE